MKDYYMAQAEEIISNNGNCPKQFQNKLCFGCVVSEVTGILGMCNKDHALKIAKDYLKNNKE